MKTLMFASAIAAVIALSSFSAEAACSRTGSFTNMQNTPDNFVAVRVQPNKSARQVGSFYYGNQVDVCDNSGGWTFVRSTTGLSGWVSARLLHVDLPTTTQTAAPSKADGWVSGDNIARLFSGNT